MTCSYKSKYITDNLSYSYTKLLNKNIVTRFLREHTNLKQGFTVNNPDKKEIIFFSVMSLLTYNNTRHSPIVSTRTHMCYHPKMFTFTRFPLLPTPLFSFRRTGRSQFGP